MPQWPFANLTAEKVEFVHKKSELLEPMRDSWTGSGRWMLKLSEFQGKQKKTCDESCKTLAEDINDVARSVQAGCQF